MRKRIALGAAIRAIRTAKNIAAAEFATKIDMSPAHLCNIEANRRPAPQDKIHRIAALLEVEVDAISYEVDADLAVVA